MIYTKRQIKTQDDRYGGFAVSNELDIQRRSDSLTDISVKPVKNPTEAKRDVLNELVYGVPATDSIAVETQKPAPKKDDLYTTRETLGKASAEKTESKKLNHSDVMPTLQTLRYANERSDLDNTVPQKSKRAGIDGKQKVLLAVYIAVALALAVAVIATGVSISTANAASVQLANSIAQKQELIVNQEVAIAELTNEATIRDAAVNNGMVYAENGTTASRVDKTEYPEADEHTNAFDKFCDWLSSI